MSASESSARALWAAVVLQAKEDVENAPLDSLDYQQAEAFFVGGGDWRHARAAIADQLDMDADHLSLVGRRWVLKRREVEGVPIMVHSTPRLPVQRPHPVPRMDVRATPRATISIALPAVSERPRAPRRAWRKGDPNPFCPFRKIA